MDETKLQERLNKLLQEKSAVLGAYDGAINETKYWMDQLNPKKEESLKDKD